LWRLRTIFEAHELPGYVTQLKGDKPRNSLLVHTCDHEVTGLKTYQGPKRKEQFGVCSSPDTMYRNESSAQSRAPVLIAVGPAVNFVSDSVG